MQAAVKAVQPVGIDHRMKVRREKKRALSEGAGVAGCDAVPGAEFSLGSVMENSPTS